MGLTVNDAYERIPPFFVRPALRDKGRLCKFVKKTKLHSQQNKRTVEINKRASCRRRVFSTASSYVLRLCGVVSPSIDTSKDQSLIVGAQK